MGFVEPPRLDSVRIPGERSVAAKDPYAQEFQQQVERDRADDALQEGLKERELRARIRELEQNTELRKLYAAKLFSMISLWLVGVMALLVCEGSEHFRFDLPDPILLATIGSTTVSVIGLFIYVTKYLYASPPSGKRDKD